jgi:hypothetical protein
LHFTPISGSWLNLVEVFFGIITRQAIRRETFASVKNLVTAIERLIDAWNERCHPFTWTKTADDILPHTPVNELQTLVRRGVGRPGVTEEATGTLANGDPVGRRCPVRVPACHRTRSRWSRRSVARPTPARKSTRQGVEVARLRSTATLAAYGLRRESNPWRALSRGR